MTVERKTLFELAPDTFVIPGKLEDAAQPPPDLVFKRDKSDPGVLYRARIEPADLGLDSVESTDPGDITVTET